MTDIKQPELPQPEVFVSVPGGFDLAFSHRQIRAHAAAHGEACYAAGVEDARKNFEGLAKEWQNRYEGQVVLVNGANLLNEKYSDVLRELCSWLAVGGFNSEGLISPETAEEKIRWGVDHLVEASNAAALKQSLAQPSTDSKESLRTNLMGGEGQRPIHSDDLAVDRFAVVMKAKLAKKREEGRGGWDDENQCDMEDLAEMLIEHVPKGDSVDIANFCMMLHQREQAAVEHRPCYGGSAKAAIQNASWTDREERAALIEAESNRVTRVPATQTEQQESVDAIEAKHIERVMHDYPTWHSFWRKYARMPLACPSCFVCGQMTDPKDAAITHAELPSILVCKQCVAPIAQPASPWETAIEHECIMTEAVAPDESDPIGTIKRLVSYHVDLERSSAQPSTVIRDFRITEFDNPQPAQASIATAIHYPECWETAAYPTVESALHELQAWFRCSNDECAQQPAQAAVPEGWKLVPKNPTYEMITAVHKYVEKLCQQYGYKLQNCDVRAVANTYYQLMLNAAPASEGGGV